MDVSDHLSHIIFDNINSDIDDEDMPSLISDSNDYEDLDIDTTQHVSINNTDITDNNNTHTVDTHDTHINTDTMYNNTSQSFNYNFQYINHLHNMNDMIINNIMNVDTLNIQNIQNLNNTLQTFIHNYPSTTTNNTQYNIYTNNAHYERLRNEINNLLTINRNRLTRTTPLLDRNISRNDNYNIIQSEIELYYGDDYYMFYDIDDNTEHSYEYLSDLVDSIGKVEIGVKDINISAPKYIDQLCTNSSKCVICQEDNFTLPIRKTICNHIFCSDCISQWLKKHHTCPLCLYDLNDIQNYITNISNDIPNDIPNDIHIKNDISNVNDCT